MKKQIRIYYHNGAGLVSYFDVISILRDKYDFIWDDQTPQIVFYRQEYKKFITKKFNCLNILWCKEYQIPELHECDFALTYQYNIGQKILRFPYYVWCGFSNNLIKPGDYDPEKILRSKTKFCAFVYSRPHPYRNQFFDILNSYKHVDSPGIQRTNMFPISADSYKKARYLPENILFSKIRTFLKDYKFVIAFENRIAEGYVTEKICNGMLVDTIPIYLGNPLIERDFNTKSFVNVLDFFKNKEEVKDTIHLYPKEFNAVAKYILELDNNDKLYCDMLSQPWYNNNVVNEYADRNKIAEFFIKIFDSL
jgi:hypothetical protein